MVKLWVYNKTLKSDNEVKIIWDIDNTILPCFKKYSRKNW